MQVFKKLTQKEITEGNKLIAEHLGNINNYWYQNNLLQYHSDWNYLMGAMEKVFVLDKKVADIIIRFGQCKILMQNPAGKEFNSPFKPENTAKIECWLVLIDYIKWYNQNK